MVNLPQFSVLLQAARRLRRSAGYTFSVVAVLALGIGAVTAIFSVVYGVLLRPYGFEGRGQLVVWHETMQEMAATMPLLPVNYRHFANLAAHAHTLEAAAVLRPTSVSVSFGKDHPEVVAGLTVSSGFFRALDRAPALGRVFGRDAFAPGAGKQVVLSWAAWQSLFGGDRSALGRSLAVDGAPMTVIGVLPEDFRFPAVSLEPGERVSNAAPYAVYEPFTPSDTDLTDNLGDFNYVALARLRPGVAVDAAQAELDGLEKAAMRADHLPVHLGVRVTSFGQEVTGNIRGSLLLLLVAVGGVLLIGCVNLANLQLARTVSQTAEHAMRSALGASRGQLILGALAENLLLAIAGGLGAILVAECGIKLLLAAAPPGLPRLDEVALNLPVLAVTAGLSLATSLAFGLVPAWRAGSADPMRALRRAGSRTSGEGRASVRMRNGLLLVEIALSLVLLVVTGLVARSFGNLLTSARGVGAEPVTMARVDLSGSTYAGDGSFTADGTDRPSRARSAMIERSFSALARLPGVQSVAVTSALPLTGDSEVDALRRPDHPLPYAETPLANLRQVSPGYFRTLGIPMLTGRDFTLADRTNTRVAILSSQAARAAWPGEDPVGHTFTKWDRTYTVIGVAGDARLNDPKRDVAMFYLPFWDYPPFAPVFLVRGTGIAGDEIRRALWSVDPQVAIPTVLPLQMQTRRAVAVERFQTLLIGCFGGAALLLAALGVYGVLSYSVRLRMREWGLRMALGSSRGQLLVRVLRDAGGPALAGAVLGIAGSLAAVRVLHGMLYQSAGAGQPQQWPWVLAGSLGLLFLTVFAAALPSARQAATAEPADILRGE